MKGVAFKGLKITGKVLYLLLLVVSAIVVEAIKIMSNEKEWKRIEKMREINTYGPTEILPSDGDASGWQ